MGNKNTNIKNSSGGDKPKPTSGTPETRGQKGVPTKGRIVTAVKNKTNGKSK